MFDCNRVGNSGCNGDFQTNVFTHVCFFTLANKPVLVKKPISLPKRGTWKVDSSFKVQIGDLMVSFSQAV